MIYFDTDVLIHFLIRQEPDKHHQANALYEAASEKGLFFVSLLCLQETAFVLHRLNQSPQNIERMLATFLPSQPISYSLEEMKRGIAVAKQIGFQHINDCLHLAIAETYCTEIYTFNRSDFKHIQKHSKLKITIL